MGVGHQNHDAHSDGHHTHDGQDERNAEILRLLDTGSAARRETSLILRIGGRERRCCQQESGRQNN